MSWAGRRRRSHWVSRDAGDLLDLQAASAAPTLRISSSGQSVVILYNDSQDYSLELREMNLQHEAT